MPCYQVVMSYTTWVTADTPEAAIDKLEAELEAELEQEPLYGPFDYDVVGESEEMNKILNPEETK